MVTKPRQKCKNIISKSFFKKNKVVSLIKLQQFSKHLRLRESTPNRRGKIHSFQKNLFKYPRLLSWAYTCRSLWIARRRDSPMFGVVDDTTTTKSTCRACAVHCNSHPVVVDKVIVVVLKFPTKVPIQTTPAVYGTDALLFRLLRTVCLVPEERKPLQFL